MKLPQFALRDLFWLVAVVAMGCGWIVSQSEIGEFLVMVAIVLGVSGFWFAVGFLAGVTVRENR